MNELDLIYSLCVAFIGVNNLGNHTELAWWMTYLHKRVYCKVPLQCEDQYRSHLHWQEVDCHMTLSAENGHPHSSQYTGTMKTNMTRLHPLEQKQSCMVAEFSWPYIQKAPSLLFWTLKNVFLCGDCVFYLCLLVFYRCYRPHPPTHTHFFLDIDWPRCIHKIRNRNSTWAWLHVAILIIHGGSYTRTWIGPALCCWATTFPGSKASGTLLGTGGPCFPRFPVCTFGLWQSPATWLYQVINQSWK